MALKREYFRQLIKKSIQWQSFGQYRPITNAAKNWQEFIRSSSLNDEKSKQSGKVEPINPRSITKEIRIVPHFEISTLETHRYRNWRQDNTSRSLHSQRNDTVSEIREAIVQDLMPIDNTTRALLTRESSKRKTKQNVPSTPQVKPFEVDFNNYLQSMKNSRKIILPKPRGQYMGRTKSFGSFSKIADIKQEKQKHQKYAKEKKSGIESLKKENAKIKAAKEKKTNIEAVKKENKNIKSAKERKIHTRPVKMEKESVKPPKDKHIKVVPEANRKPKRPATSVSAVQKLYFKRRAVLPKTMSKRF